MKTVAGQTERGQFW